MDDLDLLVVEDNVTLCESLHEAFEDRDFRVDSARSVAEARQKMAKYRSIAVALLDMMLDEPGVTGADLGLEMRRRFDPPPEFLIHTAYGSEEYYQKSYRLGAAGYLKKGSIPEVIAFVRSLRLKRELEQLDVQSFQDIARSCRTVNEALTSFCRQILIPLFQKHMGNRMLVLINDSEGTRCLRSNHSEPLASLEYAQLYQSVLSWHEGADADLHTVEQHERQELNGLVLWPFWRHEQINMVLGVFRDQRSREFPFPDHPKTLASTFNTHFFHLTLVRALSRMLAIRVGQRAREE